MSHDALQFTDLSKVFPTVETKPKPIPMASSGEHKARILLGDSDPVFALAIFPPLVQDGYEVVVTESGQDAITELRKADHPPVAILDSTLAGMDGLQICERMRDAEKNVYIILINRTPTTADVVRGLEAGADLFVSKSIPPEELLAYVKVGLRTLDRSRARAQQPEE
jgi:DNA-binding response OmpR family regulator